MANSRLAAQFGVSVSSPWRRRDKFCTPNPGHLGEMGIIHYMPNLGSMSHPNDLKEALVVPDVKLMDPNNFVVSMFSHMSFKQHTKF